MKIVVFSRVEFDIFLEILYSIAKSDETHNVRKIGSIESVFCKYFCFHANSEEIHFFSDGIITLFMVKDRKWNY